MNSTQKKNTGRIAQAVCTLGLLLAGLSLCNAQGRNQSRLEVQLAVKNGSLVVDREASRCKPGASRFTPSDDFTRLLGESGTAAGQCFPQIEQKLFNDLDSAFAQLPPFYWFALSNPERDADKAGQLKDVLTQSVRKATDTWSNFVQNKFNPWASANTDRNAVEDTFRDYFDGPALNNSLANTALHYEPEVDLASPLDPGSGTVLFFVGDPVQSWDNTTDFTVCLPLSINDECSAGETVPEAREIRDLLKPLKERLWQPREIRSRIEAYYVKQGFIPTVMLSDANAPKRYINVQKSPRIGRILLPGDATPLTVSKLLYAVLSEKEFRYYLKHTGILTPTTLPLPGQHQGDPQQNISVQVIDYLDLGAGRTLGTEPLLNQFRLQSEQLQLAQLDYVITQMSAGGPRRGERANKSYIDLRIIKRADADTTATPKAQDNAPKPATPLANKEGVIDPRPQAPELQNSFVPKSPTVRQDSLGGAPEKNNYLGGGFTYQPSQGFRLLGRYQRAKLGPGNLSLQAGGQEADALGSGNYFSDFAFFKALGYHRLALQFTGSSDVNAKRLIDGVAADERRTGGLARAELELFRDWNGHLLRFYAEGRRATVELKRQGDSLGKSNLTTLDLGAYYLFQNSSFQRSLRLEPTFRLGLGLASSEPRFQRFRLDGNFHQKLSNSYELDFTGHAALASEKTPLFELPSFGGAEVARGFRSDAALGRRLWSLQNEVWLPLPHTQDAVKGLGLFLQRNVRLAGFLDVGGIYQTRGAGSGFNSGPGLGARIVRYPMVLRLDWAYGLGGAAEMHNRGRFYFSVGVNSPF